MTFVWILQKTISLFGVSLHSKAIITIFSHRVTASLLREAVYSTIRLGAYEPVKSAFGASHSHSPLWKKLAAGATTGAFGSAIATPTDLVRVRMQGQGKLKTGS